MTTPADALRVVMGLVEKATPGRWFAKLANKYTHLRAEGDKWGDSYIMEAGRRGQVLAVNDARTIAESVNFLRTHGPAIAQALEDARRLGWLNDADNAADVGIYGVPLHNPNLRERIDAAIAATEAGHED